MSIVREGFQSADLDVPVVSPTLNLDFVNSQSLDERITFTRGSIGTFVNKNGLIETALVNQPRFDYDPITGECRGLLIEEQRTNLVSNSTTFNFFDTDNLTDGTLNPDGSSAIVRIPNSNGTYHGLTVEWGTQNLDAIGIATGATYDITFSTWLKDYNQSDMSVLFVSVAYLAGTPATNFTYELRNARPKTGTWFGGGLGGGWSINNQKVVPYPNGWYRFIRSIRYTRQSNQNTIGFGLQIFNNRTAQVYRGDNSSGIYFWGPQIENGAIETSYIPTSGSTVARSVDLAEMTGTNFSSWYNQTEGTFFFDGTLPFITNDSISSGGRLPFGVSNGFNFSNSMYVAKGNTSLVLSFNVINNGVNVSPLISLPNMTSSRIKIITSVAPNNFYSCGYGGVVNKHSRPSASIPTVTRLTLGREPWNIGVSNPIIGYIRKFAYYPKALSPAQLQYLTV